MFPLRGISGSHGWGSRTRTFAVYEDVCALAVCTQEYGILVDFGLRQAGELVDRLEELAGR